MNLEAKIPSQAEIKNLTQPGISLEYDGGQPTPLPQDFEDLCPGDQLFCQLQTTDEGDFQLSVSLARGAQINITNVCLEIQDKNQAPGPCEDRIIGIFGDRTRQFNQPFTVQLESKNNQLCLSLKKGDVFISLDRLIKALQNQTQGPNPVSLELQQFTEQLPASAESASVSDSISNQATRLEPQKLTAISFVLGASLLALFLAAKRLGLNKKAKELRGRVKTWHTNTRRETVFGSSPKEGEGLTIYQHLKELQARQRN
jgi:hypothetical protein